MDGTEDDSLWDDERDGTDDIAGQDILVDEDNSIHSHDGEFYEGGSRTKRWLIYRILR